MLLAVTGNEIVGGVLAGLIATAIVGGFAWLRRYVRNRADFGSLAGEYEVTTKSTDEAEGMATLSGTGPILGLRWVLANGTVATGTVVMNEQSRVDGSGSYTHDTETGPGWGYLRVRVDSRDPAVLRVDGTFTDQDVRTEIATAWVWRQLRG